MSLKPKVAYDIVEALDRAAVAAASDGIGLFSPGGAAVPGLRLLRSMSELRPGDRFRELVQTLPGITIAEYFVVTGSS